MANSFTFLFEVSPIKPDGAIKTLHMCSTGASSKSVYLDDKQWLPLIETPPDFEFRLMSNGQLQYASVSYGDIEFVVSDVYDNEEWSAYDWTNAQGRCWYGEDGAPFEEFQQVFEGKVSGWRKNDIYAKLALLGTEADLQVPALYQEYDGIGGREGGEGVKGQLKPRAHGYCINVTPKLFDSAYWVYQVHGYGAIQGIPMVYEFGQSLAPSVGDVATYEQLIGLTLQPGQWATCLAEGMFRMGGEPSQILTCDVLGGKQAGVYSFTAKQIIQQLIKEVKPTAQFGTFPACFDVDWCVYDVDPENVWDIVYRAANEVGGYIYPDGSGVWQAGDFYSPVYRGQLRSDRTTQPLVVSYEEDTSTGPIWKVSVGYDRIWTVHKTNEISPAIFDASAYATNDDLLAAKARFDAALADQSIQQQRMAAMAGDGILTRAEKLYWTAKFDKETNDKNEMVEDGSPFAVASYISTYEAAYSALSTYLNGLSPSFSDTSHDTTVVYSTWAAKWNALWNAKTNLAKAMIGVADWSKVVGSDKPEDNATVGAPVGTQVAGIPAEDLVAQLGNKVDVDLVAPNQVTGVSAISIVTDLGAAISTVWSASTASDLAGYVFALKEGTGPWNEALATTAYFSVDGLKRNQQYTIRVKAYDKSGNQGAWSAELVHTTTKDTTAPALPTAISASASFQNVYLKWTNPADNDLAGIEVYENSTNNSGTATKLVTVNALPSQAGGFAHSGLVSGTTHYYWLKAVDTSGNKTAFTSVVSATTASVSETDFTPTASGIAPLKIVGTLPTSGNYEGRVVYLTTDDKMYRHTGSAWISSVASADISGQLTDAQLAAISAAKVSGQLSDTQIAAMAASKLTGQVVAGQIADGAVSTAKLATGIAAVEILSALPSSGNYAGRTVFLTTDAKTYRYTGTAWTATVASADISGQLTDSQLATISAAKVSGQLTNSQIADIAASKLTGQVVATQIADGAIGAAKFAAGIEPVEILSSLPSSGNFAGRTVFLTTDAKMYRHTGSAWTASVASTDISGTLTDAQLASISAAKLTGQITSTQITDDAITTPKIAAGAVTVNEIAANTITAAKIASGTITATQIAADTITGTNIAAGAISASELAANSVVAGKVAAGAISATEIAAGAVTTSKLSIIPVSLSPDPFFNEVDFWSNPWDALGWYAENNPTDTFATRYLALWAGHPTNAPGTVRKHVRSRLVAVSTPGSTLRLRAKFDNQSNQTLTLMVRYYDAAGNNLDLDTSIVSTANAGVQTLDKQITIPTAATQFQFIIFNAGTTSFTGVQRITGVVLDVAASSELIVDGAITAGKVATGAITTAKLSAGAVTANEIAADAVTTAKIAAGAVTATEIAANAITAAKIASGTITSTEIAGSTITGAKIAAGTISGSNIASDTITAGQIAAGAISTSELAAGAVTASKLSIGDTSNMIPDPTCSDLQSWSINAGQTLTSGATGYATPSQNRLIGSATTADQNISTTNIAVEAGKDYYFRISVGSHTNSSVTVRAYVDWYAMDAAGALTYIYGDLIVSPVVTTGNVTSETIYKAPANARVAKVVGHKLASGTSGALTVYNPVMRRASSGELIVDGSITAGKVAANTISATHIVAGTITATELAAGAITTPKIAAGAVTANEIAASTITAAKIASGTITATQIAGSTITGSKIAGSTITGSNIAADTITTGNMVAGAITATEIAAGAVTASKLGIRGENMWPDPFCQDISWWKGPSNGSISNAGYVSPANDADTVAGGWDFVPSAGSLASRVGGGKGYWQLWDNSGSGYVGTGTTQVVPPSLWAKPSTTYELGFGCTNGSNKALLVKVQYFKADATQSGSTVTLINWSAGDQSTIYYRTKFTTPADCNTVRIYFEVPSGAAFSGFICAGNITLREAASGTMIVDGSITSNHITVNTLDGDRITAGTLATSKLETTGSLPATLTIGSTGASLSTVQSQANDPAARINANTTLVQPGKVVISGSTTLDTWRNVTDTTKIEGGKIATNTITATQIAANAITASEIASGTITASKMVAGTITAASGIIADAAITNAKIGNAEVDTLKIAGNAVTVPVSAFTAATLGLPDGVWTTVQQANITSSGAPILVLAGHSMEVEAASDRDVDYRILRDGAVIYQIDDVSFSTYMASADWALHNITVTDTPGAGAHTYQFQAKTNDGASSRNRSLALLETKR